MTSRERQKIDMLSDERFTLSLRAAEALGFDMTAALIAQDNCSQETARRRSVQIIECARQMAETLQVEPGFFDKPSSIILLITIA